MKIRFNFILVLLLIISIGSTLISYRTYKSFIQATIFTLHFNTRGFDKEDKQFYDDLITDIPNLSATCIPIKAIKALYLSNKKDPSVEEIKLAKNFLKDAIKDNPYIKIPEAELSKIYFFEGKKDSALYYGKLAFEGIKKNPIHFAHYAAALASVGDTATIRDIYEKLDYKDFLIDKIYKLNERIVDENLINFAITEKDTEINIFFDKQSYDLIGWQNIDIYQNFNITFISSIRKNRVLSENLFKLPSQN